MPIADSIIKTKLRDQSRVTWARRWRQEPTCRQTRLVLPEPMPQMAKFLFKLSRHYLSMMVHFISGHNHLRYHQVLTGKTRIIECRLCGECAETAWHILRDCPALEMARLMAFLEDQSKSNPPPDRLFQFITTNIPHLLVYPNLASV